MGLNIFTIFRRPDNEIPPDTGYTKHGTDPEFQRREIGKAMARNAKELEK